MIDEEKAHASQVLAVALADAGFSEAGRRSGSYIRFGWPEQVWPRGSLLVPLDPTAGDFDDLWRGVLGELEFAAERGAVASRVLIRMSA